MTQFTLLAIETSNVACSAALLKTNTIYETYRIANRTHTQYILEMIDTLLRDHDCALSQLDAIAYGCGPGSFTGVRIAASVAQGIAFAQQIPILPISSLQALAQEGLDQHAHIHTVFAATDARMHESYWAIYERDTENFAAPRSAETLSSPAQWKFPLIDTPTLGTGTAFLAFATQLSDQTHDWLIENNTHPRARAIARLAKQKYEHTGIETTDTLPIYLRDAVSKIR